MQAIIIQLTINSRFNYAFDILLISLFIEGMLSKVIKLLNDNYNK